MQRSLNVCDARFNRPREEFRIGHVGQTYGRGIRRTAASTHLCLPYLCPSLTKSRINIGHFNTADLIERQLQEDGHRTWGFVIYRTTYANDADWEEFLRRLRARMEKVFDRCNGRDILELFALTIFEDRESLNSIDSGTVREHFLRWRAQAPAVEQQRFDTEGPVGPGLSPRYRFAIQVDADSLRSVVHDALPPEKPDPTETGWVKLINVTWQSGSRQNLQANLAGGSSLSIALPASDDNEAFPSVEGSTDKYVGWMKVPYQRVMASIYTNAWDKNWWATSYCRPPTVLGDYMS